MTSCWFTSDHHFSHRNILTYTKRPFANVDEMDEVMIQNWNSVVKPGDRIYHLGDFALCPPERATKIARRLLGQKFLLFGNHDRKLRESMEFLACWIWARDMAQVEVDGQKIELCHYAMRTWNGQHRGAWQLHGHSHGSLPELATQRQCDIGVDCWNYAPVSFETLKIRMNKKTFAPIDHHEERK